MQSNGILNSHSHSKPEGKGNTEKLPIVTIDEVEEKLSTHDDLESNSKVPRKLSSRHIQFMAIGAAIGTGLFISSGTALVTSGPAPLLISYLIISYFVWTIMNQLMEMVNLIPLSGETSLFALALNYTNEPLALTAGWNILFAQLMMAPTEITACSMCVKYWTLANVAIFVSVFLVATVAVGCSPVRVLGESEFVASLVKIFCCTGLIILGVVLFFGGGPDQHEVLGFHYWKVPGAFKEYLVSGNTGKFLATWTGIIKSAFAFVVVPEMLTTTAAESENPRRDMPKAGNRFVYRLIFFYVLSMLAVTVMVASNNKELVDAIDKGASNAASSPFVVGVNSAGIKVLPHIINACIMISAYLAGTVEIYASSRTLHSMAIQGFAPKLFAKTKKGVPVYSECVLALFGVLAYINCSASGSKGFSDLSNIATIAGFINWIFVGITYLRYRRVLKYYDLDKAVPYRPPLQIFGACSTIFFFSLISLTNGYNVFFPKEWSVAAFFVSYIAVGYVIVLFVGATIYFRTLKFKNPERIPIKHKLEIVEVQTRNIAERKPKNIWEKIWFFIV